MHAAFDILAAQNRELTRYHALHTDLNGPLPHLEIANRRAQRDRRDAIPHIDADARARAIRNELVRGLDEVIATAVGVVAVLAASIGLGATVHFVGSVL
jgi:hypothetical protein